MIHRQVQSFTDSACDGGLALLGAVVRDAVRDPEGLDLDLTSLGCSDDLLSSSVTELASSDDSSGAAALSSSAALSSTSVLRFLCGEGLRILRDVSL